MVQKAPRWRNDWCKGKENMDQLTAEIEMVETPDHDPVYGLDGPLVRLWRQDSRENRP